MKPSRNNDLDKVLEHLADRVLDMDLSELEEVLPMVQDRMERPDTSEDWQRSVVSFFLINGVRATQSLAPHARRPPAYEGPAKLKVVK